MQDITKTEAESLHQVLFSFLVLNTLNGHKTEMVIVLGRKKNTCWIKFGKEKIIPWHYGHGEICTQNTVAGSQLGKIINKATFFLKNLLKSPH